MRREAIRQLTYALAVVSVLSPFFIAAWLGKNKPVVVKFVISAKIENNNNVIPTSIFRRLHEAAKERGMQPTFEDSGDTSFDVASITRSQRGGFIIVARTSGGKNEGEYKGEGTTEEEAAAAAFEKWAP